MLLGSRLGLGSRVEGIEGLGSRMSWHWLVLRGPFVCVCVCVFVCVCVHVYINIYR